MWLINLSQKLKPVLVSKKNQHDTWFYAFYSHFLNKMWPSIHLKLPVPLVKFEVIVERFTGLRNATYNEFRPKASIKYD